MTSAALFSSSLIIFSIIRRSIFDPPFRNFHRRIRSWFLATQSKLCLLLCLLNPLFCVLLFLKDFEAKNLEDISVIKHARGSVHAEKKRDFSEKDLKETDRQTDRQTEREREREKRL